MGMVQAAAAVTSKPSFLPRVSCSRQLITYHDNLSQASSNLVVSGKNFSLADSLLVIYFWGGLRLFHVDPTLVICPFERTEVRTKYF